MLKTKKKLVAGRTPFLKSLLQHSHDVLKIPPEEQLHKRDHFSSNMHA